MEGESVFEEQTEIVGKENEIVSLEKEEHSDGLSSYKIEIDPTFVQACYTYDQEWDEGYKEFIARDYPYTMSPQTTRLIASASTELKGKMSNVGFNLESWLEISERESYVMGVLRRVMVTDTIEPIIGYTDQMARHLADIKESSPNELLHIRSFFCGACVADKCLIARLSQMGITANLLATDFSADSIAVGALNFEVWNQMLPEQERYEVHIVNGDVAQELVDRDRTIILQIGDAVSTSKRDSLNTTKFDALLIDNGLQYIDGSSTEKIISNVLRNKADKGLFIGTLGLDSEITVEISSITHLAGILRAFIGKDLSAEYSKKYFPKTPYDYSHRYEFKVGEDNQILINKVFSSGSARMYTWLAHLLGTDKKMFSEVMNAIKSATELSKANVQVETSPFDYHNKILSVISSHGLKSEVKEEPLNYKDFGWEKIEGEEDTYSNGDEILDGGSMLRRCKRVDPLVLRRSLILVK